MIFLYAALAAAVFILIIFVYGLIADKDREIAILKEKNKDAALLMVNAMDWLDTVAEMEPLEALKTVQQKSALRHENE